MFIVRIRLDLIVAEVCRIAPVQLRVGQMDGESCVANRAEARAPTFFARQGASCGVRHRRRNGDPPRLGREGKLEVTEALRSHDRS
jgi:hypothetical protein